MIVVVVKVGQVGQGGLREARHGEVLELGRSGSGESHTSVGRSHRGRSCPLGRGAPMQVWVVVVVAVVVVVVVVLGCGDVGVAGGLSERVWETTDMYWIGWRSLLLLLLSFFLLLSSLEPMLSDTMPVFTVLAWSPVGATLKT